MGVVRSGAQHDHHEGRTPVQLQTETITDRTAWNTALAALPCAHVLQTWEWGAFKQRTTGWTPTRILFRHGGAPVAAASILARSVGPLRILYVSKGPALDYEDEALRTAVVAALEEYARRARAIFIKIDPDVVVGRGVPGADDDRPDPSGVAFTDQLRARGWRFSDEQIQFRNTVYIDLARDEDDLLAAMKQKTRYNVRLSARKGVTVREAEPDNDIETLFRLYEATGARDEFITRPLDYYRDAWGAFMKAGLARALIAEYAGQPLAHVILFHFGRKTWYFYGASSNAHRNLMAPYLLQWEAMRRAKAQGCPVYDLWGAPDVFDERDRMWGVWRFKSGLGGEVVRHMGAWDYPASRSLYNLYTRVMPRVIAWMKRRRRSDGREHDTA
ncbi:MAG: peptidoglycan bridge formation glycyltransferase FemA/FemB family protein [Anaerolineae bacterium]|nr:peptidoglycan bridge formation glycyltransferase FemA/FemB family protein [Anaerolineae bacterium]